MTIERKENILGIEAKIEIANVILRYTFNHFKKPTIVWSTGKDSTVVLGIIKKISEETGMIMPQALFIDHGDHFPETWNMLKELSNSWNFKVIIARNDDVLSHVKDNKIKVSELNEANFKEIEKLDYKDSVFEYSLESEIGNHLLKTVPMKEAIRKYELDALITGVRWDENDARSSEVFLSGRRDPPHIRVHPILPFLERDIWRLMLEWKLPIHPKYFEGYRSIDGIRDSKKVSSIPAWEQDLENTRERAGRSQDKEGLMEKLRLLGYM